MQIFGKWNAGDCRFRCNLRASSLLLLLACCSSCLTEQRVIVSQIHLILTTGALDDSKKPKSDYKYKRQWSEKAVCSPEATT